MERIVEAKFQKMSLKFPQLSSLINFSRTISGKHLAMNTIGRTFNSCVDKDDYQRSNRDDILDHLMGISEYSRLIEI